ncbi:MAG: hypothetical protein ACTSPL_07685 [Candidatus Odinarchaeia archaeon]
MDTRTLLTENIRLVIDALEMDKYPSEILANLGGYTDKIAVIAKHPSGYVFYPSEVAPVHEKLGSYFSDFTHVAEDIIDVYAVVSTFMDAYMAKDKDYSTLDGDRKASENFICPTSKESVNYLKEVIKEIANYPIKGILLIGNAFAHKDYCMCDKCMNAFKIVAETKDNLTYEKIAADSELNEKWVKWRCEQLTSSINELVTVAKQVKSDLDIGIEIYLDLETQFSKGLPAIYGQDYTSLAAISKHLVLNIFPWTPLLPEPNSDEFNETIREFEFTRQLFRKNIALSLVHWKIENDTDLSSFKAFANELNVKEAFTYLNYPKGYQSWRESYLKIS